LTKAVFAILYNIWAVADPTGEYFCYHAPILSSLTLEPLPKNLWSVVILM